MTNELKLISKAKDWKMISTILELITEEAVFKEVGEGLLFRAWGSSKSHILDIFWAKKNFIKYDIQNVEQPAQLAMEVKTFSKVMARAKDEDDLTMIVTNKIVVDIGDSKHYELSPIRTEFTATQIPRILEPTTLKMPIRMFNDVANDVRVIDMFIDLESDIDTKTLTMSSKEDAGRSSSKTVIDSMTGKSNKSSYSLDFILPITNAMSKYVNDIEIEFGTNAPLRITFDNPNVEIRYFLAPKVVQT